MKYIVKTAKGYVAYKEGGEYAFTQDRASAKRYSDVHCDRVKRDLLSKGVMATKVAVCE